MSTTNCDHSVRIAISNEYEQIGHLMVQAYAQLDGFPKPKDQPAYYEKLANIGVFAEQPNTQLLVAVSKEGRISGAVVYFNDMKYYGSGGSATTENNASGFRLLAVHPDFRGLGIGKLLTLACITKTKEDNNDQLIIHSTKSMKVAWRMYKKLGFKPSEDLDFTQGSLAVFGFRLYLNSSPIIVRTTSQNSEFKNLVIALDKELAIRDGEDHLFYDQFNKIDAINHCVVLYHENNAIGCGAIKRYDSKSMEVKRMYVLPEHRGKGKASIILNALETWALELGCVKCILETGKKQPEAIQLYMKNGYSIIPNYGQYATIENSICFEKILSE